MRKNIILFVLLFGYICLTNLWGCATGEHDKYEKLSASDKKAVNELCGCLEIVLPYREKIKNAKLLNDTPTVKIYEDSLNAKKAAYGKCMGSLYTRESEQSKPDEHTNAKEYTRLFSEYLYDKHPLCAPYILGTDSINFK